MCLVTFPAPTQGIVLILLAILLLIWCVPLTALIVKTPWPAFIQPGLRFVFRFWFCACAFAGEADPLFDLDIISISTKTPTNTHASHNSEFYLCEGIPNQVLVHVFLNVCVCFCVVRLCKAGFPFTFLKNTNNENTHRWTYTNRSMRKPSPKQGVQILKISIKGVVRRLYQNSNSRKDKTISNNYNLRALSHSRFSTSISKLE